MSEPMTMFRFDQPHSPDGGCVGTIALAVRDSIKTPAAVSLMQSDFQPWIGRDEYLARFIIQGNILTQQRNECVRNMDGDWLLFVDDDMVFQPDAVARLVETWRGTGADIVGGLCFQRSAPHQPTLYRSNADGSGYAFMERWAPGGIVDVDATGMAFVLISKQALEKILRHVTGDPAASIPSLEERRQHPSGRWFQMDGGFGEDFYFCRMAKAAGCRIVVDTSIEIGHIAEKVVGYRDFLIEMALRHPSVEEARSRAMEPLGIRVMDSLTARGLLEEMSEREAVR